MPRFLRASLQIKTSLSMVRLSMCGSMDSNPHNLLHHVESSNMKLML